MVTPAVREIHHNYWLSGDALVPKAHVGEFQILTHSFRFYTCYTALLIFYFL
eukprot:gene9240-6493_t